MRLKRLMLSGFRSWENLTFDFTPGLTILTGPNGAGKTSIRMGVQYALTGNCSGLTKKDLVKDDTSSPFKAGVQFDYDGQDVSILRDASRVHMSVNGVPFSVREASFLARLKLTIQHTFLSPDQGAFVDVQSFKRKEMLEAIIPAVDILRGYAGPRAKELAKKMSEKRFVVYSNINSSRGIIDQTRRTLAEAEARLISDKDRVRMLQDMANATAVCSQVEYEKAHEELTALRTKRAELDKYCADAKAWIDWASVTMKQAESYSTTRQHVETDMARSRAKIDGLNAVMGDGSPLACPHCSNDLVCNSCGTSITDGAGSNKKIEAEIKREEAALEGLKAQLETLEARVANIQTVDAAEYERIRDEYMSVPPKLRAIDEKIQQLVSITAQYDQYVRNSREVAKIETILQDVSRTEVQVSEMRAAVQAAESSLARKERTATVMDGLCTRFAQCADIMNSTIPNVYFDRFLAKLTTYCNYLLEPISSMRMQLYADDQGIHVLVDGKQFNQLSSGERQRIRIATTLAFSLLGRQSDTLFVDEVFDNALDEEGVVALATLLSTTMRGFYEKIILVSHQPALVANLSPDRIVHIECANKTSSIKEL